MVNIKQSNGVLATGREQTNLEGILREILLRYLCDQKKSREPRRWERGESRGLAQSAPGQRVGPVVGASDKHLLFF